MIDCQIVIIFLLSVQRDVLRELMTIQRPEIILSGPDSEQKMLGRTPERPSEAAEIECGFY